MGTLAILLPILFSCLIICAAVITFNICWSNPRLLVPRAYEYDEEKAVEGTADHPPPVAEQTGGDVLAPAAEQPAEPHPAEEPPPPAEPEAPPAAEQAPAGEDDAAAAGEEAAVEEEHEAAAEEAPALAEEGPGIEVIEETA